MDRLKTEVLFLNKEEVDRLITYPETVAAVERAFRSDGMGQMRVPDKEIMPMGGENALFAMAGCLYDLGVAGVKWTNFYPQNPKGYPPCWAHVLVLSHVEDGRPYAILDATSITNYRTAGGHAVAAAKYLANPHPRTLGVMGCGAQGMAAVRSFSQQFDLEQIRVYSSPRSAERARPVLERECPVPVYWAGTPEEMAEGCDIIVTATTSEHPLLMADMVPPGCLVAAMYSFHDVDPALSRLADKWVLGHRASDLGEIRQEKELREQLDPAAVYAALGEVVCGQKPGREHREERIVYSHMGMATLDIAVADALVEKARAQGVGRMLRLT